MDASVVEMRPVKDLVNGLDQFVDDPHWDSGVERMSEANRWVSLWSVLTFIVRRMVCLSWRPVAMSEASVAAVWRWSLMNDWQKAGLPTGTPRTQIPSTSSHLVLPSIEYWEMALSRESAMWWSVVGGGGGGCLSRRWR